MSSIMKSSAMVQDEIDFLASSKFESFDELVQSVRTFYYKKGYGISIRNSTKDKHVTLQCDRSGCSRDIQTNGDNKKKKSRTSRLTDCPFRIIGKKGSHGPWVFKIKDLRHNHEPSTDMSKHPLFCRLPPDSVQSVKDMTLAGIPPREILSTLRQQTPNLPAVSRTIYNLKAKIRKDNLRNKSMVSSLFEELEKSGFSYDILRNSKGHITNLFIAHPLSVKLAKVFPNIFVMDCTYKTNKYDMTFLDIIGVSCFNTSFYSGFAFLEKEDEESYIWVLSAFRKILGQEIYPFLIMSNMDVALMKAIKHAFSTVTNLLCVWHIEQDVMANCKKYFVQDEEFDMFISSWNNVVCSTTESSFEKNWGEFELLYKDDAFEYIRNIWLPWKEKFVSAWTEKHLHFGNRSSSRAKDAHAKLIMYLEGPTGDFQGVRENICLAIEHEFSMIKWKLASNEMQIPHEINIPLFGELKSYVSEFALKEIYKQYQKTEGSTTPCTGHFMATMGLPCAHKIKHSHGSTLPLELIHPHWRVDTLSLNSECGSHNDGDDGFIKLLNELYSKYQSWPQNKREYAILTISKLINQSDAYS
uniref:protein FAR1-RELATED SEQUENCE 5-like n=1 Tax=Erigeron canadensis TaxID=72917 RepID=UPI001CB946D1|nr:protein FAR1-RELATED SEQUENCE 5-like [Erigeron canadensis]